MGQNKDFVVVLDAGHGGKDPGKIAGKNMFEKDIALKIVLEVGDLLEKTKGIKVVYTRKTDVFVELKERGRIANKADANLFVSVHCNAHNTQAEGAETWVLGTHANKQNFEVAKAENAVILLEDNYKVNYKGFDPNSPESVIGLTLMQEEYLDQSIQLASIIQNEFITKLRRKDRGVKQAGFVVLHQTYMPSILIETGFITNSKEGLYLNSKLGQQKFSESIYNGIKKYINQLTLNTVQGDNLTSGNTSGVSAYVSNNCTDGQYPVADPFQYASLDLGPYVGNSGLRVKFTFSTGPTGGWCNGVAFPKHSSNSCGQTQTFDVGSGWAIDDVGFVFAQVEDELEWRTMFFECKKDFGSYIFKFWQGTDDNGEDLYLTVEVPVVE